MSHDDVIETNLSRLLVLARLAVVILAGSLAIAAVGGCARPASDSQGSETVSASTTGSQTDSDSATTLSVTTAPDGSEYVSNEVIVVFKDAITSQEASEALKGVKSVIARDVSDEELDQAVPAITLTVADGHTVDEAIEELEGLDVVASAQRNRVLYPSQS